MVSEWCPSEELLTVKTAYLVEPDGIEPSTSTMPLYSRDNRKCLPRKGKAPISGHHRSGGFVDPAVFLWIVLGWLVMMLIGMWWLYRVITRTPGPYMNEESPTEHEVISRCAPGHCRNIDNCECVGKLRSTLQRWEDERHGRR